MYTESMSRAHDDAWNWKNVPVPEPHVAGILVGLALHSLVAWTGPEPDRHGRRALGWSLIGSGLVVVLWAVRTVGGEDIEHPTALVTTGPYARSRNPMYVAWTTIYVGVALVRNTVWMLLLLPAVMVWSHITVRREERSLERRFGDEYLAYRRDVRRYV